MADKAKSLVSPMLTRLLFWLSGNAGIAAVYIIAH